MSIFLKKKKSKHFAIYTYTSCSDTVKLQKCSSVWMCTYPRLKDVLLEFKNTAGFLGNVHIKDGTQCVHLPSQSINSCHLFIF